MENGKLTCGENHNLNHNLNHINIILIDDIAFEIAHQIYKIFEEMIVKIMKKEIDICELLKLNSFPKVCRVWRRAALRLLNYIKINNFKNLMVEISQEYCPPEEQEMRQRHIKILNDGKFIKIFEKSYMIFHFIKFEYLWKKSDPFQYKLLKISNNFNDSTIKNIIKDKEDEVIIRVYLRPNSTNYKDFLSKFLYKKNKKKIKLDIHISINCFENEPRYSIISLKFIDKILINSILIISHFKDKNEDFLIHNSCEFDSKEAANMRIIIFILLKKNVDSDDMIFNFFRKIWPCFNEFFKNDNEDELEIKDLEESEIDNFAAEYLQNKYSFFDELN